LNIDANVALKFKIFTNFYPVNLRKYTLTTEHISDVFYVFSTVEIQKILLSSSVPTWESIFKKV